LRGTGTNVEYGSCSCLIFRHRRPALIHVNFDLARGRRMGVASFGVPAMDESIRRKILALLAAHRIMTIATLRPDGWPQATTVGYVSEGLVLYFLCGPDSQKARNLALDDRVSLTIDHDVPDIMGITGLSMAARARLVEDAAVAERILRLLPGKYAAPALPLPFPMPTADQVRIFRVEPEVISVLDYTVGFGHTDLVECDGNRD
jgi:hypothetical protein